MVTRSKAGIYKLNPKYAHFASTTTTLSPIPRSVREALKDDNWRRAMQEEYDALNRNKTWTLVPRPAGAQVITGKWVFKHKFNSDRTFERYKARWVVRGFHQWPGVNFGETFSPVIKHHPHCAHADCRQELACPPTRRVECVPPRQAHGTRSLPATDGV
jgi:hypothetical protein